MTNANFLKYSVVAMLFFFTLTPTIYIPGFIGIRLEEIFIIFLIIVLLSATKKYGWTIKVPLRVILLLIFLPLMLISTLCGAWLALPATLADLTKLIWLIKAVAIYLLFYNFIHLDEDKRDSRIDYVLQQFIKFAVISAFVCFQQYFDIFGINSFYIPIVAPTQYATLMPGISTPRVVGMLGNPNVQGYLLSLAILTSIFLRLKGGGGSKLAILVLFVALMMTLSRGAFVAFAVGGLSLFLIYQKEASHFVLKLSMLAAVICLLYVGYQFMLDNETLYKAIMFRFELLENPAEDESFMARYDGWEINMRYFALSPIFGVGLVPRATDIFIGADNEWLLFLRAFGVVGTTWLILFWWAPLLLIRSKSLEAKNIKRFIVSLLLLMSVFMIPAGVVLSPVTSPVMLVLLSILDITIVRINRNTHP